MSIPEINLDEAGDYLRALDPTASAFTFQTFDDDKQLKRPHLARVLHGPLATVGPLLAAANAQGAGAFVAINECMLEGSRSNDRVVRIRELVLDLDGVALQPVLDSLAARGLKPHIVVRTSEGKYHVYLGVKDCPLDRFKFVQQALAREFGSDPAVCDLARVMRLPGFFHCKGERVLTRLLTTSDHPAYALSEIVSRLSLDLSPSKPAAAVASDGHILAEGERHTALCRMAGVMRRSGMSPDAIEAGILQSAAECGLEEGEALRIARDIGAKPAPPVDVVNAETEIENLASLSAVEYEMRRKAAAEKLGMRASALDSAVYAKRPKDAGSGSGTGGAPSLFPIVELWPDEVNGVDLLDDLRDVVKTHLVLGEMAAEAVVLWVLWTYVFDTRDTAPMLFFTSPTPACGKTTALTLIARLASRVLLLSSMTAATVFRLIEAEHPTLAIDEADSFATEDEELRGLLNSGHSRDAARVVRVEEIDGSRVVRLFSTWAPKVLAAIGRLPGTIESRSVIVQMQRKTPGAQVTRLARRKFPDLQRQCTRWAADNLQQVADYDCAPPEWLDDRAFDSWLPLLAVANAAGGAWPQRALDAARALSGAAAAADEASSGTGVDLLRDTRDVFDKDDRLHTGELISRLCRDETLRWSEYQHGKSVTPRQIAGLLRPFGIVPGTIRLPSGETPKGYLRRQFEDAWSRYLPAHPSKVESDPQHRHNPYPISFVAANSSATKEACGGSSLPPQPNSGWVCGGVADEKAIFDVLN